MNEQNEHWKAITIILGIIVIILCAFMVSNFYFSTKVVKINNFEISQTQFDNLISQVDIDKPATICDIQQDICLTIMLKENNIGG